MDDQYDLLARVYRNLITTSGHLKNEQNTILKIISELNLTHDRKILDAACGTGDALLFLYQIGYPNLFGLDFSEKMLEEAKIILPDIPYYHSNWNSLSSKTELENSFDLVLVISVSILHVGSVAELEMTLHSFWSILKKNGTLVIDNRVWQNSEMGLIEGNREINQSNYICKCNIAEEECNISDSCYYCGNKQIVEYELKSRSSAQTVKVSYLRIATSSIIEILYKTGFSKVSVKSCSTWPYELIYAHK